MSAEKAQRWKSTSQVGPYRRVRLSFHGTLALTFIHSTSLYTNESQDTTTAAQIKQSVWNSRRNIRTPQNVKEPIPKWNRGDIWGALQNHNVTTTAH